ncbi:MAG: hypothetical protein JWR63_1075 [Conexibacter sp.]|nr:hypothetical protein [Conexibacter sp.]
MIVIDAHTNERFEIVAKRGGETQLRSLDNPGAPARFESAAGLAKDYVTPPAPTPLGSAEEVAEILRAADHAANIKAARAYARAQLRRERLADELGIDPADLR